MARLDGAVPVAEVVFSMFTSKARRAFLVEGNDRHRLLGRRLSALIR